MSEGLTIFIILQTVIVYAVMIIKLVNAGSEVDQLNYELIDLKKELDKAKARHDAIFLEYQGFVDGLQACKKGKK